MMAIIVLRKPSKMDRLRTLSERKPKYITLRRNSRRWHLCEDGVTTIITVKEMGKTDCWKIFCQQISKLENVESVSVEGRIRKIKLDGTKLKDDRGSIWTRKD